MKLHEQIMNFSIEKTQISSDHGADSAPLAQAGRLVLLEKLQPLLQVAHHSHLVGALRSLGRAGSRHGTGTSLP